MNKTASYYSKKIRSHILNMTHAEVIEKYFNGSNKYYNRVIFFNVGNHWRIIEWIAPYSNYNEPVKRMSKALLKDIWEKMYNDEELDISLYFL